MKSDIMHIVAHEKANPLRGGDAKPPVRADWPGQRGYRSEQGLQDDNNAKKRPGP